MAQNSSQDHPNTLGGNSKQSQEVTSKPLTSKQAILREIIHWLRWPPLGLVGMVASIGLAIFGHPSATVISLLISALITLSQIGGLVDGFPRIARWCEGIFRRLLLTLHKWFELFKGNNDRIDDIWQDQWDSKQN